MGGAAAFSFYPGKNLGACGEGGAVTTDDPEIAQKVRMLRDHGQSRKYHHEMEGYNGRLDAIQCGILRIKLRHLAIWNKNRRLVAARYCGLLSEVPGITLPYEPNWSHAVYHLYVVRTAQRDEVQKRLAEEKIGTELHYPVPLHLQYASSARCFRKGDLPITETVASQILSLPMYTQLRLDQQVLLAEKIKTLLTEMQVASTR